MSSIKNFLIGCTIIFAASGCSESLEYKYSDNPVLVSCPGADQKLLNEAWYSFYDDIMVYYGAKSDFTNSSRSTYQAYAKFIYDESLVDKDYKSIISPHTLEVMKVLKNETQLWDKKPGISNLNYKSEYVNCLVANFKDRNMAATIQSLIAANSISPKLMADRFRMAIKPALEDPNFGMYIALDTYYQYLFDLEF